MPRLARPAQAEQASPAYLYVWTRKIGYSMGGRERRASKTIYNAEKTSWIHPLSELLEWKLTLFPQAAEDNKVVFLVSRVRYSDRSLLKNRELGARRKGDALLNHFKESNRLPYIANMSVHLL